MGQKTGIDGVDDSIGIPVMGSTVSVSSGVVANASAVATLPALPGQTAYVSGFQVTASGATSAARVTLTLAGLAGGAIAYNYVFINGAAVSCNPLMVTFSPALPASAPNTAIVLTLPAGGAGNAGAAVSMQGFYL
jgi:hypothetical protein